MARFCDAWRDPVEGRPADLPIGWVTPVGQPLAPLHRRAGLGRTVTEVVRRRFEVNDGIVGWGQGAFAALPHLVDTPLDWRGPYPAMPAGATPRRATPGCSDHCRQLGSGPDRGGGFGAEPDRRHRPVAARDRDPERAGGPQPVDHGAVRHRSMPVARSSSRRWHDVPGNRLAARRRAPPGRCGSTTRARRLRRVRAWMLGRCSGSARRRRPSRPVVHPRVVGLVSTDKDSTRRSMSSSTLPVLGRSRLSSRSLSSALVRPS